MGKPKAPKSLLPKETASAGNADVLLLVDGSDSISPADFLEEKKICDALSARLNANTQLGVIQFGATAKLFASLTTQVADIEKAVQAMTQIGGSTNLLAALELVDREFATSKKPNNKRQVWIVTDGECDNAPQTALAVQKLARERQVTIYAIGVGKGVSQASLNRISSLHCSFLVKDFSSATKLLVQNDIQRDRSVQITATLVLEEDLPLKLGQDMLVNFEIENVGKLPIPSGSRIIFKSNDYFREKFAVIPTSIASTDIYDMKAIKLVPKIRGNRSNLDSQVLSLPPFIEYRIQDDTGNDIHCDSCGFMLNHEDFAGDIYQYVPMLEEVPLANIITFGPPGAGKSTFVDSVISALGESIAKLNVAGASRNVVTSGISQFPLNQIPSFEKVRFAMYDIPGIDGKNYKGEELALCMHGLMPVDIDFKHQATFFTNIRGRRSPPDEEFRRRAHVVAFFVPQGFVEDTTVMNRLSECLYQITVLHKRKAIVIISHADEIPGEEERSQVMEAVCQALSIDTSNIFFLENYVNSKVKQFHVDKNVLRILLAMISRADDFLCFNKLNPIFCPFEANTLSNSVPVTNPSTVGGASPQQEKKPLKQEIPKKPEPTTTTTTSPKNSPKSKPAQTPPASKGKSAQQKSDFVEQFVNNLPDVLQEKMKVALDEQAIDDEETVRALSADDWKGAGFKIGEVKKIEKALAELQL